MTPASSEWVQSWTPNPPAWLHWWMKYSSPWQFTWSSQIGPRPEPKLPRRREIGYKSTHIYMHAPATSLPPSLPPCLTTHASPPPSLSSSFSIHAPSSPSAFLFPPSPPIPSLSLSNHGPHYPLPPPSAHLASVVALRAPGKPSSMQTTFASFIVQMSSQMVPHSLL